MDFIEKVLHDAHNHDMSYQSENHGCFIVFVFRNSKVRAVQEFLRFIVNNKYLRHLKG